MSKFNYTKALGTVGRMYSETPPDRFVDSLSQLLVYSNHALCEPNQFIHYNWATISWHELGREQLVSESLGDWLLMLDTDHIFSPDLLERLLFLRSKYNTRVISGLYGAKQFPHFPVANTWTEDGNIIPLRDIDFSKEVQEIGPVGGGVLLIDRSVLFEINDKLQEPPFKNIAGLSEDYSFCARCRRLGIPVYLAPNIESHHLMPREPLHFIKPKISKTSTPINPIT